MIRRHFLAGVVGLKAMCAAAALAVGIGQAAEAATYDVIFTITRADHDYIPYPDGENTSTPLSEWWGMAVNTPLRGILEVTESIFPVLTVNGLTLFGGPDWGRSETGPGAWLEGSAGIWYNHLTWNGSEGTWNRTEDYLPDYYLVDAEISLAPVPLPTTAALLPLGIGALAFLRKRRRLVS